MEEITREEITCEELESLGKKEETNIDKAYSASQSTNKLQSNLLSHEGSEDIVWRAEKPNLLCHYFDFIAGFSTGGFVTTPFNKYFMINKLVS